MNTRLAQIISVIFQPLLMPTILFAILLTYTPTLMGAFPPEVRWRLLVVISLLTFGIPVVSLLIFRSTKWISDLSLTNRKERFVPFLFILSFYAVSTYLMVTNLSQIILLVNMIYLTMGLLVASIIITLFWKISIHSAAIAATSGFLCVLEFLYPNSGLFLPMLISLVCTGATMTARLQLRVHTLAQVVAGASLGFAVSIIGMLMLN